MAKRQVTPLSDTTIRNAKPKEKDYTLPDGNGLQLLIKTDGKKIWEIRYTVLGKAKKTTAGIYPAVSLKDARAKRDEIKTKVSEGIDPIQAKKETKRQQAEQAEAQVQEQERQLNTFEKVAREFLQSTAREIVPRYYNLKLARMENHFFPYIGEVPIDTVTRKMIIECVDRLKVANKAETARRSLNAISQIYRYAVTREYTPHNIIADIDKRYLIGKKEERHFPTITDEKELSILINGIENYTGEVTTKCALKLAYLTAQRPFNIRSAEWDEFDLVAMEWRISAEKMKMKRPHIVPISRQLKEVLEELAPLTKHKSRYLFPAIHTTTQPMSENTVNQALRRLGYTRDEIVGHGFRAMFTTIANEHITEHGYHTDVIERHLAHVEKNKVKGAYNRAEYMEERRGLVQWWADYLDRVKND